MIDEISSEIKLVCGFSNIYSKVVILERTYVFKDDFSSFKATLVVPSTSFESYEDIIALEKSDLVNLAVLNKYNENGLPLVNGIRLCSKY